MKKKPAWCYGKWSMTDPACSACMQYCRVKCEEATKRRLSGEGVVLLESPEEDVKADPMVETTPADYFLKTLEGKFEKKGMEDDGIYQAKFFENGEVVVFVALNIDSGKVKVISRKCRTPRIVKLESIEEAEKLLQEVL